MAALIAALDQEGPRSKGPVGRAASLALALLVAVPAAGLWPAALEAQRQPQLQSSASSLARAWASGADQAVASQLASDRVTLQLEGLVSATLPTRQATAALRTYMRGFQPGEVQVARVSLVEGSEDRGFVELRWNVRRIGTSQTLRRTVFLGLRQEGRTWTVEEVRVFH